MIKYFRDLNGNFGNFDDSETTVPHQIVSKAEYDAFVASQPSPTVEKDFKDLYSKALTATAKTDIIAEKLGLI